LRKLSFTDEHRMLISGGGAISPLVAMLGADTESERIEAMGVLGNLAIDDGHRIAIAQAGAIGQIIELLRDGTTGERREAMEALGNFAIDDGIRVPIVVAGALAPLVRGLVHGFPSEKAAAVGLLQSLALSAEARLAIVNAGAVKPLAALLRLGGERRRIVGALRNLALDTECAKVIAAESLAEVLVELLNSIFSAPSPKCADERRNVLALLGALAASDYTTASSALQAGALLPISEMLQGRIGHAGEREDAAKTLASLALGEDGIAAIGTSGAIDSLVGLLRAECFSERAAAADALARLAALGGGAEALIASGAIDALAMSVKQGATEERFFAGQALTALSGHPSAAALLQTAGVAPPTRKTPSGAGEGDASSSLASRLSGIPSPARSRAPLARASASTGQLLPPTRESEGGEGQRSSLARPASFSAFGVVLLPPFASRAASPPSLDHAKAAPVRRISSTSTLASAASASSLSLAPASPPLPQVSPPVTCVPSLPAAGECVAPVPECPLEFVAAMPLSKFSGAEPAHDMCLQKSGGEKRLGPSYPTEELEVLRLPTACRNAGA